VTLKLLEDLIVTAANNALGQAKEISTRNGQSNFGIKSAGLA